MKLDYFHIDAFTNKIFGGNPASVVPLKYWLEDAILLKIAKENAQPETAFFVDNGDTIHLRWFTPELEMDLCGHATLATVHVLVNYLGYKKDLFVFDTLSGPLTVTVLKDVYTLDFPARMPVPVIIPDILSKAVSKQPKFVLKSRDYVLVYESESEVKNIGIDKYFFDQLDLKTGGVIVTAVGENCDFVSRFFTPNATIMEDPVTGSAHCSLIPYWSVILNKNTLVAQQISSRMGDLVCVNNGERVLISGKAKTYSMGSFWIE